MVSMCVEDPMMAAAVAQIASIKRAMVRRLAGNLGIACPGDEEDQRLQTMLDAARAPESCGPEIPVAPARGRILAYAPQAVRPTATGYEVQHDGFRGRDAARAADVFDVMLQQVARRGGEAPFTPGQIEAGRTYAMLVERHSSVSLRCISIESQRGSGSAGGAFMDAVLAEGEVIRRMEAAIGMGMALEVQRETGARRDIPIRRLVDMVCLEGKSVTAALRAFGWPVYGGVRGQAYAALGDALDRMRTAAPGR